MLRASAVEIHLSPQNLLHALAGAATGRAEVAGLSLEDGAIAARLKVSGDRLPMAVTVELRLTVRRVSGTEVEAGVAIANMPLVPGFIKEMALARAFEALPGTYQNGVLLVDVTEALDHLPVSFQIETVEIKPEGVRVVLRDVAAYPVDPGVLAESEPTALVPVPSTEEARLPEHQGYYQELRQKMTSFAAENAPKWVQPLLPWVLAIPDFFVLAVRLTKDERVPAMAKVIAGVVTAYFITPIDLIPDVFPLMGQVDDVAVALFALEQIGQRVPAELIQEHWPGEGKVLDLVREGTQLFSKALPGKMLTTIRRLISR